MTVHAAARSEGEAMAFTLSPLKKPLVGAPASGPAIPS